MFVRINLGHLLVLHKDRLVKRSIKFTRNKFQI